MIEYTVNDTELLADKFILFVNQIWKGNYDLNKTTSALSKTINITAYDGNTLIGCLRILSDGYYFGTITELLVLPKYQNSKYKKLKLLKIVKNNTLTMLYFGYQIEVEKFYEKNGCQNSL